LKPGGHLVAFAGSRTVDLMMLSIRLAGFEIRDSITCWVYGSGFPKSLDVSKAIDKAAGAQREVLRPGQYATRGRRIDNRVYGEGTPSAAEVVTAPATPDAARWSGFGTALKPAHEPIILARRPLAGTVAANVLEHGTGALNIDGCRTATDEVRPKDRTRKAHDEFGTFMEAGGGARSTGNGAVHEGGRWPTNVILTHPPLLDAHGQPVGDACTNGCVPGCPVAEMDRQSGVSSSSPKGNAGGAFKSKTTYAQDATTQGMQRTERPAYADQGGASRFFPVFRYEAKAPASERPRLADGTTHNTVKPVALMQWLVRLVTPPGGTVLDWCAGSGTTLEACLIEGFDVIGVEEHGPYAELCRTRLSKPIATALFGDIA
jgi:site-specific DNA-methyltransferase (adenine-specific)